MSQKPESGSGVVEKVRTEMESILTEETGSRSDRLESISGELSELVKRVERIRSRHGIQGVELSPYITTMIKLVGSLKMRDSAVERLAVRV